MATQVDKLTLTGAGASFTAYEAGGFSTDGQAFSGTLDVQQDATPTYTSFTDNVYAVTTIADDAWHLYNHVAGG